MSIAVAREFGGYEILARLKSGGMASLYLGRRIGTSGFSRHVAIKFIHDHLAEDQDFVRMFVDEALLQARISHPNVVHVEELGERDGKHFLVMEYVHGCALSQLLRSLARRDRALPHELAVYVTMQVAAGLHAAHELRDDEGQPMGVVHRDVSPDNVLLAYDGHVKLIDFGVAKVEARVAQTSAGLLKGKLRYMSPEQAGGGAIDRRTDVYALAVVLWEMLTMHRLFGAADQLVLLETVRNPTIPPPSSLRPTVPAALEAVVMKALSRDPAERHATAHDFRRALAEAMPAAALTDASQLGELLGVVMASEIENDQKRLPPAASSVFASAPRPSIPPGTEEQGIATRTISITGLGYLGESGASKPPAGPRGASLIAPPAEAPVAVAAPAPPPVAVAAPVAPPVAAPMTEPVAVAAPETYAGVATAESSAPFAPAAPFAPFVSSPELGLPEEPSTRRPPVLWLAAAAVALVALAGVTFFVVSRLAPADEVQVTPLVAAPAPPSAPAAPTATTPVIPTPTVAPAAATAEPAPPPTAAEPAPPAESPAAPQRPSARSGQDPSSPATRPVRRERTRSGAPLTTEF
jgi:serine/threonine-protein kinase